jgi:hypothetical protein
VEFLLFLALLLLTLVAVTVGLIVLAIYGVKRSNRISPKAATPAPTAWLASPSAAARLHRRLKAATRRAQAIAKRSAQGTEVQRLAAELEHESLVIGDELAVVASAPAPHRRAHLAAIEPKVQQVESLAQRLAAAANPPQTTPGLVPEPEGLDRIAEALDTMDAARAEVDRAERGETGTR